MMRTTNKFLRFISLVLFAIGILLGMTIAGGIIWGDLEASLFDSSIKAKSSLDLSCPVAITANETGFVTATLDNPVDREKNFYVRAHISEGYVSLKREIDQQILVAPGDKGKVRWEIYPEDAAFNRIILFRAYVNPSYPVPSQGNFCGVLVLDIPYFTGAQVFLVLLGLSIVSIIGGSFLWRKANFPMDNDMRSLTNAMYALAVIIFGTIVAGYSGNWILGVILFASSILMIGIIFGRYFSARL
jgi:hypothetical protein